MDYQAVADYACHTGENPLWHPEERRLYWTDIPTGRLFRYDPASDSHEKIYEDRPVGGFTIQADGSLLLFRDKGNVVVFREGRVGKTIIDRIPELADTRFNDVIADPAGRVFAGTMPSPSHDRQARLYRIQTDGAYDVALDGVGLANGMGFTPDAAGFYFTDTPARTISRFDYDAEAGTITHRRPFVETPDGEGAPDGMAVDATGGVWSARWGGAGVMHYDPHGKLVETIALPTSRITSIAFAGEHLDTAYITSAGGHDRGEDTMAGVLFRVTPGAPGLAGVTGRPEFRSRVGLG